MPSVQLLICERLNNIPGKRGKQLFYTFYWLCIFCTHFFVYTVTDFFPNYFNLFLEKLIKTQLPGYLEERTGIKI